MGQGVQVSGEEIQIVVSGAGDCVVGCRGRFLYHSTLGLRVIEKKEEEVAL